MKDKKCTVRGCKKPERAKGLCERHYRENRLKNAPECVIEGCEAPAVARHMCRNHYMKAYRSESFCTVEHIILLGHRQQHGKDTVGKIMFDAVGPHRCFSTMFAKMLKKHCAERYNLDFDLMGGNEYKMTKPVHLAGKSVRDVLLEEGMYGRGIWLPVWASGAYREVFNAKRDVGIITDFRFPNEFDDFEEICNVLNLDSSKTTITKVLVDRPDGEYKEDGADNMLPDDDGEYWDYVIKNDVEGHGWFEHLKKQSLDVLKDLGIL